RKLWEETDNVFGTWLGYSEKYDVLIEAGMMTRDTLRDEARGMRAFRASDGAVLWHQPDYYGPALLHGGRVLKGGDGRAGSRTGGRCGWSTPGRAARRRSCRSGRRPISRRPSASIRHWWAARGRRG